MDAGCSVPGLFALRGAEIMAFTRMAPRNRRRNRRGDWRRNAVRSTTALYHGRRFKSRAAIPSRDGAHFVLGCGRLLQVARERTTRGGATTHRDRAEHSAVL